MSSSRTISEAASAENVFTHAIGTITRVFVHPLVGDLAKGPMQALECHQDTVLALKKRQRASSLAAAYVNAARMRTELELRLYSQRRALSLTTFRKQALVERPPCNDARNSKTSWTAPEMRKRPVPRRLPR